MPTRATIQDPETGEEYWADVQTELHKRIIEYAMEKDLSPREAYAAFLTNESIVGLES